LDYWIIGLLDCWIVGLMDDRAKYARYFIGWIDGFVDEQHTVTSLGWIDTPRCCHGMREERAPPHPSCAGSEISRGD